MVCLCLPIHSKYLLKFFNINIFGFLKQNYKTLLAKITWFTTYNFNKANFIFLIQKIQ